MAYIGSGPTRFNTADDLTVTDDAEIGDNATVGGDLSVTGTTTLTGDVTVDTDTLFVDASGDAVGIGTTSPSDRLEIAGNTSSTVGHIGLDTTSVSNAMRIIFRESGTSKGQIAWSVDNSALEFLNQDAGGYTVFYTTPTGGSLIESMRIDSSGRVTMPYQPSFRARGLTVNVGDANGDYIFVFPTAVHNIGGHYNTSTGKFTAPVAGTYHFSGQVYRNGSEDDAAAYLMTSAGSQTELRVASSGAAGYAYMTMAMTVYLNANDQAWVQRRFGDLHANSTWSYFSGHLVG